MSYIIELSAAAPDVPSLRYFKNSAPNVPPIAEPTAFEPVKN